MLSSKKAIASSLPGLGTNLDVQSATAVSVLPLLAPYLNLTLDSTHGNVERLEIGRDG